jgi:hypothetical protein
MSAVPNLRWMVLGSKAAGFRCSVAVSSSGLGTRH